MRILAFLALAFFTAACASAAPTASTHSTDRAGTPIVIGESFAIASASLDEDRTYNVWLPPGYEESGKNYPVLYLVDGGLEQDFQHISGLAQLGSVAAMFEDVIVVGVETKDRQKELTFPTLDQEHLDAFPTLGHAAEFRALITDEIMPVIEQRYRTSGSNGLIGESLAGLFIVDTFLNAPESFDVFISISPSTWWDNGSLGENAAALVGALPPKERKLYLAIADEGGEMRKALLKIVDALKVKKAPSVAWMFSDRPDLEHSTIYHREALEALVWAYPRKELAGE